MPAINESAIQYWSRTNYTQDDVDDVCRAVDLTDMAIRITFDGDGNVNATLTERTWARQEGHYPTIADYFGEIARHPSMQGKKGALIVWIEDGLFKWHQKLACRAPILAFGRYIYDQRTALIPDPAFIESRGYEDELAEARAWLPPVPWQDKAPTVFWRGATTGLGIESPDWVHSARGKLVLLAKEIDNPEILDAKFSKTSNLEKEQQETIRNLGVVDKNVLFREFLDRRYLVDADGYCSAWRSLFLKLASGCATLKIQSDYEQWYFRELIPWKNFVPLCPDLRDFNEVYSWLQRNDDAAHSIAEEGAALISRITYERCFDETAQLCAKLLDSFR